MKICRADINVSIIAFIVVGLCVVLFYMRYTEWGIPSKYVISFISLFSIAAFVSYISCFMYRDFFNPLAVYCLFIFFWGYSYLPITDRIVPLSDFTTFLVSVSVLSFILGVLFGKRKKTFTLSIKMKCRNRKVIMYCVMVLSFLSFSLECVTFGYVPVFQIFSRDVYGETLEMLIPILHYFVMLANIIPTWAYLQYKEKVIDKKGFRFIFVLSVFIIINYFSRQLMLLGLLSAGLTYLHYNKISFRKMVIILIVPVLLFLGVGALRLLTLVNDQQSQKEYLSSYSGLQYEANLLEIYGALYASKNYTTLDDFVQRSDKLDFIGYGVYTFKPILTITLLNRISDSFQINPDFHTEDDIPTYIADPYLDFGLIGLIVYNLFLGFITSCVYKRYKAKEVRAIGLWSAFLFCIIMNPFINYFNTFFIWLIIVINTLLIPSIDESRKCNSVQ